MAYLQYSHCPGQECLKAYVAFRPVAVAVFSNVVSFFIYIYLLYLFVNKPHFVTLRSVNFNKIRLVVIVATLTVLYSARTVL